MQTEYVSPQPAGQRKLTPGQILWDAFRYEVVNLYRLDASDENLLAFRRTVAAYRALRSLHVQERTKRKTQGHSATLERWTAQREKFRTKFYGVDEGHYYTNAKGKRKWKEVRRFKGVPLPVANVMRCYQALWSTYWPHTPEGRESLCAARRRYARSPQGLATTKAYRATERGQAALRTAKANAKRKRSVAKGVADQALYDSWAAEGALDDV